MSDNYKMLIGSVDKILHQGDDGYIVFSVDVDGGEEVVCVCTTSSLGLDGLREGERVSVSGDFVQHPRYGRQLSLASCERRSSGDSGELFSYLAGRNIRGIGRRRAQQIIDVFGEDTQKILENHPEQLAKIKGISKKRATEISEEFRNKNSSRTVILELQQMGVGPAIAKRLLDTYQETTLDTVRQKPYSIADLYGIGFKTADNLAYRLGIENEDSARIGAGIRHCLLQATSDGHVFLPMDMLVDKACALLNVHRSLVEERLSALQLERVLWQDRDTKGIYLSGYAYSENLVAKKLLELSRQIEITQVLEVIEQYELNSGVILADAQREAVLACLKQGLAVITGGPGTGKTTTIRSLISLMRSMKLEIELCAPTGRAAKRMSEATGSPAKTIHRLLEVTFSQNRKEQTFGRNKDNPLECDVLIVDEASMIDISLMANLVSAIPPGMRLVLVGDVDQLPSVGAGNVLKDIILSGHIPVVRLCEIFRQAQESEIVVNAHRINSGEYPIVNSGDFFLMERHTYEDVASTVCELVSRRLPAYLNTTDPSDIQVLTPMRKSVLGANELNRRLQAILNPPSFFKQEHQGLGLRTADKVMQMKNNYNLVWRSVAQEDPSDEGSGVFNGDMGIISEISTDSATVLFEGERLVRYEHDQLQELSLAYATTIHKSQGSEYRAVVLPILDDIPILFTRNLLYTAITRARELVVIVGRRSTVHRMVDNNRETNRFTSLHSRIDKLAALFLKT